MLKDKIAEILENYRDDVVTTNERGTIKDQKVILNQATLAILTAFKDEVNNLLPNLIEYPCCKNGCGCGVCRQIEVHNNLIIETKSRILKTIGGVE